MLHVIIGPTASGKSALAMTRALREGAEIVSADSRHIYRGMNIGANKPGLQDRAQVPHHMIDLRDAHEPYGLAEYVQAARAAIAEIEGRGQPALLVGGTGQWVAAVLQGWQVPEVPPQPILRTTLEDEASTPAGVRALEARLRAADPEALTTIDPRNVRRVIRALEVIAVTGQRWSALQARAPRDPASYTVTVLRPERERLYAAADARLLKMISEGWIEETRALLDALASRGIDHAAALRLPAMSALGYRQMARVSIGAMTLDEAIVEVKHDTRRYIRMQETWFRKIAPLSAAPAHPPHGG